MSCIKKLLLMYISTLLVQPTPDQQQAEYPSAGEISPYSHLLPN